MFVGMCCLLTVVKKKLAGGRLPQNLESHCVKSTMTPCLLIYLLTCRKTKHWGEKNPSFSLSFVVYFQHPLLAKSAMNPLGMETCSLWSPVQYHKIGQ